MVDRYQDRLSGPFLDRIDLQIFCQPLSENEMVDEAVCESSAEIARRVVAARQIQARRFEGEAIFTNSQMNASQIERYCVTGSAEKTFLKEVVRKLGLSARAYSRILKLARTIADLEGNNLLTLHNISEAVQYRSLDRRKTDD